mmetsp:Transcript_51363/g.120299  ORF Transcript_51363/g.120299 Transcript_51363/m.120299 type:complete len:263 (-) Transcript_51363:1094-1882(-)
MSLAGKRKDLSQMSAMRRGAVLARRMTSKESGISKIPWVHKTRPTASSSPMPTSKGSGMRSVSPARWLLRSFFKMIAVAHASKFDLSYMDTVRLAPDFIFITSFSDGSCSWRWTSSLSTKLSITRSLTKFGTSMRVCCETHFNMAATISKVNPFSVNTSKLQMWSSSSSMNAASGSTALGKVIRLVGTFFSCAMHISPTHHARVKMSSLHITTSVSELLPTVSKRLSKLLKLSESTNTPPRTLWHSKRNIFNSRVYAPLDDL